MKKTYLYTLVIIILITLIPTAQAALLKDNTSINAGLQSFGTDAGYDITEKPLATRIGEMIQIALGFVGTLFLILILISGFQWMTAGGSAEKITKAKGRMINAIIGLAIVLAAYSITWFITTKALNVTVVAQEQTQ